MGSSPASAKYASYLPLLTMYQHAKAGFRRVHRADGHAAGF